MTRWFGKLTYSRCGRSKLYSLSQVDRSILLLTGFPAAFVRSPDCTTWRSLLVTNHPLMRFSYGKRIGRSHRQKSSVYVGCPTDYSNWTRINFNLYVAAPGGGDGFCCTQAKRLTGSHEPEHGMD